MLQMQRIQTLHNKSSPEKLKDLCTLHYINRYIHSNYTELTSVSCWDKLISSKHRENLFLVILLCKENVSSLCYE